MRKATGDGRLVTGQKPQNIALAIARSNESVLWPITDHRSLVTQDSVA
jgi:hypothetical protein